MEELLQQSGSRPDLAVQSFSSLLTTQPPSSFLKLLSTHPPSSFLTLLSSPSTSAGHLQKNHPNPNSAQTNLHFYDSQLQYNDYDGDYSKGDNILFFEYDDNDQPSSEDLGLVGQLTDRQGEVMRSITGITIENQLFLQMRICPLMNLVMLVDLVVDLVKLVVVLVRQHS